jgi:hypothetical protein
MLVTILIYVYPLKILFGAMFYFLSNERLGQVIAVHNVSQARALFGLYALGTARRDEKQYALVRLPAVEQAAVAKYDSDTFSPVPGYWGTKGWTYVQLASIDSARFRDLLLESWRRLAPKKMNNKTGRKGFTGSVKKPGKKQMRTAIADGTTSRVRLAVRTNRRES